MHPLVGPFKIPAINDFIPEKVKPWIFVLFVVIFQFAGGGIYLATLNESVGDRALMKQDITMAGFASMTGMCLVFTIMLRLKMRIITKHTFITCVIGLIACNIICLYTNNVLVLVAACFVAGIFRMWATFECNSTIQLWITPTRDMPIFFSYVYLLVNSIILLGGSTDIYIAIFANVNYINYIVIGLLLSLLLIVFLIFNSNRFIPKFPLFGIDWLGGFMWGMILLNINFIVIYGEYFDWFHAEEMQIAMLTLIILLTLNIYRASFIRHPFISLKTFTYKSVWRSVLLYLVVDILIGPSHIYEHIFFEKVLNFDHEHMIDVNLISWIGVLVGGIFAWRYFAVAKHSFKSTFNIGFASVLLYNIIMYFFIDYQTTKEMLIIPLLLRNFGYVIIAVVLLSDLMKVPFQHFFQAISVQAFISAACGAAIGSAVLGRFLNVISTKNFQLLTSSWDNVNPYLQQIHLSHWGGIIQFQVLLVSIKEIYCYLVIGGIIIFIGLILYRFPYLPKNLIYPKRKTIDKFVEKEIAE